MRSKLMTALLGGAIAFLLATNPAVSSAAGQITGRDIKNGSITGKDVRNGSLTAEDVSGSLTGPAGPAGPAGAPGPAGEPGQTGADATHRVPSGKSISGFYAMSGDPQTTITLPLPMRLAGPIDSENVNFGPDNAAATIDDDPSCAGSFADPTAPAGKFCLYWGTLTVNISSLNGRSFAGALGDRGILVVFDSSGGNQSVYLSWAYTAP